MAERDLDRLLGDLSRLEAIVDGWDSAQQQTVQAIRTTLEEIQAGAFRRLIRTVKAKSEGLEALKQAVDDPWVFSVLDYHRLLRPPEPSIEDRIEAALDSVRPTLASHDGNVQFVAFVPPSEVQIRLMGTCDGCAFSGETVRLGIEKAIFDAVPEVKKVSVVTRSHAELVQLGSHSPSSSPFEKPWQDAGLVSDVREGAVHAVELEHASILLTKSGGELRAYPNACPHLGMPLDTGEISDGVLTCRYHGFQYVLDSGECLTAPDVALPRYPVRVEDDRVRVQVTT